MSYQFTTTSSQYPSKGYFDEFISTNPTFISHFNNTNASFEQVQTKLIMLNVYYKNLEIDYTYQNPAMSFLDLLVCYRHFTCNNMLANFIKSMS